MSALKLSLNSISGMLLSFILLNFMSKADKIFRTIFGIGGQGGLVDDINSLVEKKPKELAEDIKTLGTAYLGNKAIRSLGKKEREVLFVKPAQKAFGGAMAFRANHFNGKNKKFQIQNEDGTTENTEFLEDDVTKFKNNKQLEEILDLEYGKFNEKTQKYDKKGLQQFEEEAERNKDLARKEEEELQRLIAEKRKALEAGMDTDDLDAKIKAKEADIEELTHERKIHDLKQELEIKKYEFSKSKEAVLYSLKENIRNEKDPDMREMMNEEQKELEEKLPDYEKELKILLLPKDENDDKNVIVEIRGGAGGDEAALFAGDLFRMYNRYAERRKWKVEIIEKQEIGIGGIKEAVFSINGLGAYSRLKFESGVHRVQRVPETESAGRVHTSTATVAVLPEVEDVKEVKIDPKDLKIDTYRSGGAGGQHVNMTDSAVRITHLPTGIVVQCQDERSQLKNREKAMKHLVSKLYEMECEKQRSQVESERKLQVGTGDRSEKIRTYNFPQGRITDHRIKFTVYQLDAFLDGDIDEMIDALITFNQAEMLASASEE